MLIVYKKTEEREKQNVSNRKVQKLKCLLLPGDLEGRNAVQKTSKRPGFMFVTCALKYRLVLHRKAEKMSR